MSGNIINASMTIFNTDISGYSWPVTIANGTETNPVVVTFGDDITLDSTSQYFIIGSEYITIDGGNYTVTIDGVNYPGLVQNGTSNSIGKSNVIVKNINMSTLNNSTLANYGGWIGRQYFGRGSSNVIVDNCSSSGAIGYNAGGICGCYAGRDGGEVNVSKCYSSGAIGAGAIGDYAGGICGGYAGYEGTANVSKCYSSGAISGAFAGGIYGAFAGDGSSGEANVSNSYSSGAISGNAGGIFGASPGTTVDSNTYVANNAWTDASANTKLIGTPTESNPMGNVWSDIAPNDDSIAWILSINYVPPSPPSTVTTIDNGNELEDFLNTSNMIYGNIKNNLSISYNLSSSSKKILSGNNIKIVKI